MFYFLFPPQNTLCEKKEKEFLRSTTCNIHHKIMLKKKRNRTKKKRKDLTNALLGVEVREGSVRNDHVDKYGGH